MNIPQIILLIVMFLPVAFIVLTFFEDILDDLL